MSWDLISSQQIKTSSLTMLILRSWIGRLKPYEYRASETSAGSGLAQGCVPSMIDQINLIPLTINENKSFKEKVVLFHERKANHLNDVIHSQGIFYLIQLIELWTSNDNSGSSWMCFIPVILKTCYPTLQPFDGPFQTWLLIHSRHIALEGK